jgi:hypothetical protein
MEFTAEVDLEEGIPLTAEYYRKLQDSEGAPLYR